MINADDIIKAVKAGLDPMTEEERTEYLKRMGFVFTSAEDSEETEAEHGENVFVGQLRKN